MTNHKNNLIEYGKNLSEGIKLIDFKNLTNAIRVLKNKIKKNKQIFVCGNGGSAAITNHYIADYLKLLREKSGVKIKIFSLSDNVELITAISNDIDFNKIFSYQLESLANKNDLLLLISSSGNSQNIINALKFAKKNLITTIGFSGFDGGYLKKNCDIPLHFENNSYQLSEDFHHILMHFIMNELINELK